MAVPGSYSRELGQRGFDRIADTLIHHADSKNAIAGSPGTDDGSNMYHHDVQKWIAIKIIEAAVIDHTETVMAIGDAPNSTDVLVDGDIIQGPFLKIKLTSGKIYAYRN